MSMSLGGHGRVSKVYVYIICVKAWDQISPPYLRLFAERIDQPSEGTSALRVKALLGSEILLCFVCCYEQR